VAQEKRHVVLRRLFQRWSSGAYTKTVSGRTSGKKGRGRVTNAFRGLFDVYESKKAKGGGAHKKNSRAWALAKGIGGSTRHLKTDSQLVPGGKGEWNKHSEGDGQGKKTKMSVIVVSLKWEKAYRRGLTGGRNDPVWPMGQKASCHGDGSIQRGGGKRCKRG